MKLTETTATTERQLAVACQWKRGEGELEYVNGGVDVNTAWLAMIGRAHIVLNDENEEQRCDLRVTEIFRRGNSGWERVHRHADPLVDRRSPSEAARLLAPLSST